MLNQHQQNAIKTLNDSGWSDGQIGKAIGCTSKAVWGYRRRNDISPVTISVPKIVNSEALRMYENGESDAAIARKFKVDQTAAFYWRKRKGFPPNFSAAPIPKEAERTARKMLKDGATRQQVADAIGCSPTTVQRVRAGMDSPHLRRTGVTNKCIQRRIRKDPGILKRIETAIGTKVPQDVREHASYDMYADLFEGVLSVELIEERASRYRNKAYSMCGSTFEHARLDAANDQGLTLLDRLSDELIYQDE